MKQYSKEMYDYHAGKWIILKTDTPITCRKGEGSTRCRRCNMINWDKFLYNYKDSIYCDDCLIALLRVSE